MKSTYKGFTLIEITLVMVLIAILIAITTPLVSSVIIRNDLVSAHESLYTTLLRAQQLSKNNYQNSQWRVCIDDTAKQYVITAGTCSSNLYPELIKISPGITVNSSQTLDIVFKAINGELDYNDNSIIVNLSGGGVSKSILITKYGIIDKAPSTSLAITPTPTPTPTPVAWTPAQITTAIWLDAADSSTITESGGVVSQWDDKSGNGRHFTQATVANRPTFESAVQNGLSAVKFVNGPGAGATRQFVQNTSYTNTSNQLTLFSVHRNLSQNGANTFGRLFSFAALNQQDYNNTSGIALTYGATTGISLYRNSASIASTVAVSDTWYVVDAVHDAGNGSVSLNGGTRVTGSTSAANFNITRTRIGNDFNAADSGMQGWVGENIAISGVIDASTTEKMQGYLAWKWGLEGSLPAGHPYKNAAPTI